jgi:hypothetical protein
MNGIEQLLAVASAYMRATGLRQTTLSSRVFDDGKRLTAIENGAGITVARCERALQWFSDNWPEKGRWPAGVPRPRQSVKVAC